MYANTLAPITPCMHGSFLLSMYSTFVMGDFLSLTMKVIITRYRGTVVCISVYRRIHCRQPLNNSTILVSVTLKQRDSICSSY